MNPNAANRMPDWDPTSTQVTADQVAAFDVMRCHCPVAYSEARGWSVFRHADVMRILNDHATFSNKVSRHISVPNGMDPPEHTVYQRIIDPYFCPDRMAAFEPTCRSIASELLREMADRGGNLEVMSELATHFAVRVQCTFRPYGNASVVGRVVRNRDLVSPPVRSDRCVGSVSGKRLFDRSYSYSIRDIIMDIQLANSAEAIHLQPLGSTIGGTKT